MKLQLIVVETGERWRRALLRMVLDPKNSSHNDYGSIQTQSNGISGGPHHQHHTVDIPGIAHQSCSDETGLHSDNESVRLTRDMTQSDLYQRQPLLPPSTKANAWTSNNTGDILSPPIEYYDEDDKTDGLAIHRGGVPNGVIKIDIPAPLREEPRFPKEKWKTFIAFLIMASSFMATTMTLALIHERVPDKDVGPLSDVFLDSVAEAAWALDVSEILIMIATTAASFVLVFHKHRFIVMRRVFLILAALYLMRSVTMFVTVLPVSSHNYYCSPKMNTTSGIVVLKRAWQLMTGFGLSINGKHTYCGDYIYSGHTVILVLSYLIIGEYSPRRCFPVHWLSWCLSLTGIVMVLWSHGHYTVDVIIAYYVTTTLFWIYHTLANNANLKQNGPNNFLSRMWWFPLFWYFEKNVGGPVPRQYEWPLPWPRRCHGKHPNRNS
ncbi:phosphatidylcholine:ceramide cholinephosphotransferase 2 isoform X2 [Cryptotermes secundus]|uniref:phosphatidylcholine:ceramide cholinephosphotransferase 2 isoform X2 n=1 Tax=Cryptotermes secundus TaxID=105785 RepID=UPI000CD7BD98|nr:phosphatidylcholine:ceramide cholinephosphotransferase 2 isoform X2 [Cryptotermes secundus]